MNVAISSSVPPKVLSRSGIPGAGCSAAVLGKDRPDAVNTGGGCEPAGGGCSGSIVRARGLKDTTLPRVGNPHTGQVASDMISYIRTVQYTYTYTYTVHVVVGAG